MARHLEKCVSPIFGVQLHSLRDLENIFLTLSTLLRSGGLLSLQRIQDTLIVSTAQINIWAA